jgi:hypothetical protein
MERTDLNLNQPKFYGFFQAITDNYLYSLFFIFLVIMLIITLKYAESNLDFPESKMILRWFAIIVMGNLLITYVVLMMYNQVKNQKGLLGGPGFQGPIGNQGKTDYCATCEKKLDVMEQEYEVLAPPQPLLPEKIIIEPIKDKDRPKKIPKFAA